MKKPCTGCKKQKVNENVGKKRETAEEASKVRRENEECPTRREPVAKNSWEGKKKGAKEGAGGGEKRGVEEGERGGGGRGGGGGEEAVW